MNIRILIISLIALGMQSITFGQDKAKLEKECLDLFKTVSLPFELKANEDGIQSPEQGSLTAEMQEKIFNMGGFDEEGFGMHMGAVGKVELSKGMYLLMYSTLVVPVPSHMDEYSFDKPF